MTPSTLRQWRKRHKLTLEAAAHQLGIGRRSLVYYESGQSRIPAYVAILCWYRDQMGACPLAET